MWALRPNSRRVPQPANKERGLRGVLTALSHLRFIRVNQDRFDIAID
jgi:hypothetical protein